MSEALEIKGLAEAINSALVPLRTEIDAMKARDHADPVTVDKLSKAAEEITGKMQELQDAQAKMKARLDRPGGGDDDKAAHAEAKKKLTAFMRDGDGGRKSGRGEELEIRAMSTDNNPMGGYLTMPSLSQTVVSRIFETSPVRQVANVEQTDATTHLLLIDDDEAAARWVGEGASGGETDTPDVGRMTVPLQKIEADPRMTVEQSQSAYLDAEAWLARKVADKFSRTENTAFVTGNGVSKPRGFLTYPAWAAAGTYERGKIEQVNSGSAATVTADGFINLQAALKEAYQPGAVWGMKRATFGVALTLKGADNYYFSPVLLRDGQLSMQLLGKPVIFMDDMPALGAGNLSVVYGDFSRAYTIIDGPGLTVLRDPYSAKGFITYYTTKRVGGDVSSFDAIKIGKCST